MTRLGWSLASERVFEAGVDQGVLYLPNVPGVPWNGLVSIAEAPTGADITPLYVDGVKYLDQIGMEEYAATIEAFTYPEEFAQCEGISSVSNGLFVAHQQRKTFGLSYRTLIGNDIDSVDHAYKIHLIYNATASPTERSNTSMTDSIDPFNFSWAIVAKPPVYAGYKPSSHLIIDSSKVPIDLLSSVENILYGEIGSDPRLPSVSELVYLFTEYGSTSFDAGHLTDTYFAGFDAGRVTDGPRTSTIDGGTL